MGVDEVKVGLLKCRGFEEMKEIVEKVLKLLFFRGDLEGEGISGCSGSGRTR